MSSEETENDPGSSTSAPTTKKKRSSSGAATYKTKFNKAWSKEFNFISAVRSDPYRLGNK